MKLPQHFSIIAIACMALSLLTLSCGKSDDPTPPSNDGTEIPDTPDEPTPDPEPEPDTPPAGDETSPWFTWPFAKGADCSWVTEMEDMGYEFKHVDGTQGELMEILKDDCGVNSIRFRVWVDPAGGWNSIGDVVEKSIRANNLGLDVMIDFHLSDTWADPGHQSIPSAWQGYNLEQMKQAVAAHVNETLQALKDEDITPKWVQIGNETRNGFLWNLGEASTHPDNFAALVSAGYDAVKNVFPEACVIVHEDNAQSLGDAMWLFGILKTYNARYDMIGLSLYPDGDSFMENYVLPGVRNAVSLATTFEKPVMFVEVGMSWTYPERAAEMIQTIMDAAKINENIRGVFYWEPEANPQHDDKNYHLGAFNPDGSPTSALSPFLSNND